MVQFQHCIAPTVPIWAVLADEEGKPIFQPVVAIGVFNDDIANTRLSACMVALDHLFAADFLEHFVGYSHTPDDADGKWSAKCAARREQLNEKKRNPSPIIVPDEKKIQFPN